MTQRRTHLDMPALCAVLGCCVLWGLNQVAIKAVIPQIAPLWQAAARSVGGALLVAGWSALRGVPLFGRDGTLRGGLLAGTLFALEFLFIFLGLQYTTASRMAVFLYISPFVVALGMPFIARAERLGGMQIGGLLLAFGGVAWAFAEGFGRPAAGPQQWWGDLLGVLAGLLWGATTLAIRGSRLSAAAAEKTLLYQLATSGVLLVAAALVQGAAWPRALTALAWWSLAFQVIVVSAISYLVWFWLVRRYAAARLASFTLLTPVFGMLAGALLLAEPVTSRLLIALFTVCAGIVVVNRPAR